MTTVNANRQIARAAGTVMLAFLFSQVTGLVRGILVARTFGASIELDAFLAANQVAETLFSLIAGGALGSAFIPTFTGLLARDDRTDAWKLASSIATLVTLTLTLLAMLAALFAPQVVRYALAPGLAENPATFALTVALLRIQLVSAVLFGLGGLVTGILNAHQVFLVPALTPAMYQLGIIFGTVALAPTLGIYGLAWGVVIGASAYLLIQVPSLLRQNGSFSPTPGIQNANVQKVLLLMGPRLLGVAIVQLNFWVNIWLGSQMEEGSLVGLRYGFSLMLMAQVAIAQSIAIAAMPTFSAQHALGKVDDMRASLAASLRGVMLLSLPASVGLMLLRVPLISALYQRGNFDEHDVQLVAWALLWYAAGLVGHSIMEILTRAFYAQQDTRTPVIIGTVAMGLNVAFSILFSRWFAQIGWFPLGGLALANSLATAIEAAALFVFMRRRLKGIEETRIARGFVRCAGATLGMAVGLWYWIQATGSLNRWIVALGGVALGGLLYLAGVLIFKVPEVRTMIGILARRIQRSPSS